jgi:hypothetical protein
MMEARIRYAQRRIAREQVVTVAAAREWRRDGRSYYPILGHSLLLASPFEAMVADSRG